MSDQNELEKEFEFYLENQAELLDRFEGKYVVIKGRKVLGAYDDELDAINETSEKEPIGTFLVQMVEPGDQSYTQTFHSRVCVA